MLVLFAATIASGAESQRATNALRISVRVVSATTTATALPQVSGDIQVAAPGTRTAQVVHPTQTQWGGETRQAVGKSLGAALKDGSADLRVTVIVPE